MPITFWSTLVIVFILSACDGDGDRVNPPPETPTSPATTNFGISRLPAGPHMGIIVGFESLAGAAFDREANADILLDQAATAGASISRIQIDWSSLETAPGVYDNSELNELLAAARSRGQAVYVTLSTLDSDGLTLPEDLLSDGGFRNGLTAASAQVLQRFTALIDWLVPQLGDDVWSLSLGNEVDSPINDGLVSPEDALVFYTAGINHLQNLAPEIAATVTLTIGAPVTQPTFTAGLMARQDLATFNHYCLDEVFNVTDRSQWEQDVTLMRDAARGLPIMIQELGCPVGYGDGGVNATPTPPNGNGGSPALQETYLQYFDELFLTDPQFRAATVFQLYDWSPQLAQLFGDFLRSEGETVVADRFEEWLATIGLCRWADGTCRPAWTTFLTMLGRQAAARSN